MFVGLVLCLKKCNLHFCDFPQKCNVTFLRPSSAKNVSYIYGPPLAKGRECVGTKKYIKICPWLFMTNLLGGWLYHVVSPRIHVWYIYLHKNQKHQHESFGYTSQLSMFRCVFPGRCCGHLCRHQRALLRCQRMPVVMERIMAGCGRVDVFFAWISGPPLPFVPGSSLNSLYWG